MDRLDQSRSPRQTIARYNDVLGLGSRHVGNEQPLNNTAARGQLLRQGFSICETAPEHWILTVANGPQQLHLYGADELALFATRAHGRNNEQAISQSTEESKLAFPLMKTGACA